MTPSYFLTCPLGPKWQQFAAYLAPRIGICVVFRWDLKVNQIIILYPDFPASNLGLLCLGTQGLDGKLWGLRSSCSKSNAKPSSFLDKSM